MDKQFTASEVREYANYDDSPEKEMLYAYADLLESQEKAVPVHQFRVIPKGSTWTDVKDDEIWAAVTTHPESYETRILYTHSAPSDAEKRDTMTPRELAKRIERGEKWKLADEPMPTRFGDETPATHYLPPTQDAERLAEALRELTLQWRSANPHGTDKPMTVGAKIAYTWCAEQVEEILAAHSAQAQPPANQDKPVYAISRSMHSYYTQDEEEARQAEFDGANVQRIPAQPPAASVTDAMVNRLACWMIAQFGECRAPVDHKARIEWWRNQARSALEAALAAQENPNG